MIIRSEHSDGFTIIDNGALRDSRLSDGALRLLVFMLSCSDNWEFSAEGLAICMSWSVKKTKLLITELKRCGYIEQVTQRGDHGHFLPSAWVLHEIPLTGDPKNGRPVTRETRLTGDPCDGSVVPREPRKMGHLRNTNYKEIPNIKKDKYSVRKFSKPSFEEIADYCKERGNAVDPQKFLDHYEANGWKVGRNPMKDWRAAVRNWERSGYDTPKRTRRTKWRTGEEAGIVSTDENRAPVSKITKNTNDIPSDILDMLGD